MLDFNKISELSIARSKQVVEAALAASTEAAPTGDDTAIRHSVFHGMDWREFTAGRIRSAPLPKLEWTFPNFLLTHNVALLVGLPGTGKSYFGNQLGSYVASGRGCEGIFKEGGKRGRVLVLAGEEDERIVPYRVTSLARSLFSEKAGHLDFNRDGDELAFDSCLIVKSLAGASLQLMQKAGTNIPERTNIYNELTAFCKTIDNLQLIIIDPLSRFCGLDENSNGDATEYMTALEALSIETGASIVCIHHIGKGGKTWRDSLAAYSARGASGFVAAARAQINIVALTKKEAESVIAPAEVPKNNEYLAISFPKCSYGPTRPVVFLRRGPGGILRAVEPAEKSQAELQTEETILKWLRVKIAEQEAKNLPSLTVRSVGELTQEWGGIIGATKTRVRDTANAAVINGELFLEMGKNRNGVKASFLRLADPEKASDFEAAEAAEPSGFEAAREAASFKAAKAAESGQESLAGL